MKTCCFCFDLKGGATASAVFTLVIYVKAVIGGIIGLILINHVFYAEERRIEHYTTPYPAAFQSDYHAQYIANVTVGVVLAISAFTVLSCVLLLIGIQKGIRGLFFPWITVMGLKVGMCAVAACLMIPLLGTEVYSVLLTLGILIAGTFYSYMVWCVSAYYNNSPAITAVTYQTCEVENRRAQFQEEFPHKLEKDTKQLV